jgi:hypothetical protein
MAKSQRHGNREAKKPKKIKVAPMAQTAGLLAKAGTAPASSKGRS